MMEAIVRVMDGNRIPDYFDIPEKMRNERIQVIIVPFPEQQEKIVQRPSINRDIMRKFQAIAESGEFKAHLKRKLAQGVKFEFDAQKIIEGTETEDDKQNRYKMEKRAWSDSVADRVRQGEL
ncbi:MAG: hypothetical protein LBR23_02210 [Spirochaetaceae bacterium]|jgi:hypothetical protein|nr:hypothetical protein [Spirochaetaceae bacterium]